MKAVKDKMEGDNKKAVAWAKENMAWDEVVDQAWAAANEQDIFGWLKFVDYQLKDEGLSDAKRRLIAKRWLFLHRMGDVWGWGNFPAGFMAGDEIEGKPTLNEQGKGGKK